jgi:hypothetical protein
MTLFVKFLFVECASHGLSLGGCHKLFRNSDINILIIVPYILESCKWLEDAQYLTFGWYSAFIFFSSLLFTKGYKPKSNDVQQKCHEYEYDDMLKMNTL